MNEGTNRKEASMDIIKTIANRSAPVTAANRGIALTVTLGVAAACWVVSVERMGGMNMGVATTLGSFGFFVALWAPMMAAMMLPGAVPAVARHLETDRTLRGMPLFLASYLAVWTLFGVVVYALYRPHGTLSAGVVVIAAGIYELTPVKRHFRRRCREVPRSGLQFGVECVASSIGLMVMLVAVGVMSIAWMSVIVAVVVAQKLLPTNAAIDLPVAVAIVGLGILILAAPSAVPGLMPTM
jgi:predicted metal-binding membrane protein